MTDFQTLDRRQHRQGRPRDEESDCAPVALWLVAAVSSVHSKLSWCPGGYLKYSKKTKTTEKCSQEHIASNIRETGTACWYQGAFF